MAEIKPREKTVWPKSRNYLATINAPFRAQALSYVQGIKVYPTLHANNFHF